MLWVWTTEAERVAYVKRQAYMKQYYEKNKERIAQQQHEYYLAHKEQISAYNKDYYRVNKSVLKPQHREYNRTYKKKTDIGESE